MLEVCTFRIAIIPLVLAIIPLVLALGCYLALLNAILNAFLLALQLRAKLSFVRKRRRTLQLVRQFHLHDTGAGTPSQGV